MNPGGSFPSDDWRYPSPSSTPRSDKPIVFPLNDPLFPSPSLFASESLQLAPQPQSRSQVDQRRQRASMAAPALGQKAKQKKRAGAAQTHPGQSLTESFIGKFDGASISDSTSIWQDPDQEHDQGQAQVGPPQMQTPPPTRDTSVKRRAQQQAFSFTTPSTIKSRRQSTFGDDWLRRGSDVLPLEASPLHFSPLHFSPTDAQGPMTAPVQTDSAILWDPDSHNPLLTSFSASNDDPFFSSSPTRPDHLPSTQIQSKFKNALRREETLGRRRSLGPGLIRSSSARISGPSFIGRDNGLQASAGVDPSVLWSSQGSDVSQLKITDPPSALVEGRNVQQPYQYQFEEHRREKELLRQGKAPTGSVKVSNMQPLLTSSTMPSLRRSMTDSKSRVSLREGLFTRPEDGRGSFSAAPISRHSSPLKRQRTGTLPTQASPSPRKSVSLTVDEQGRARTVVTSSGDDLGPSFASTVYDESDSSDELPLGSRQSSRVGQGQARNDAQEALREVMKERQQRKQEAKPRSNKKQPATDSFALSDVSPTLTHETVPKLTLASDLNDKIQCLCLGGAANAYMIECDSCKKWSHLECLGLGPDQAPRVFMCVFCREQLQAAAGPSAGEQSNGAVFAAPLYDPKLF